MVAPGCPSGSRDRDGSAGRRRQAERRIVGEDLGVQKLQILARLDTQFLDEQGSRVAIGGQCVGLAARPVQRQHQLAAQGFAERMLDDEGLQLRDSSGVVAEREVRLDATRERHEPEFQEAIPLGGGEIVGSKLGQRWPAPQLERLADHRRRVPRVAGVEGDPSASDQGLEPADIDFVCGDSEPVAAALGLQQTVAERLPQLIDVAVDDLGRSDGRVVAPDLVDQGLGGHDLLAPQHEQGQQGAWFGRADLDIAAVPADHERAEDAELHRLSFTL